MRLYCTIIFVYLLNIAEARVGLGETYLETPGGHGICDCDPYTDTPVLIDFEDKIKLLKRWYFFKGYIIGEGENYFFIFEEMNEKLQYFTNEKDWEIALQKQRLNPFYTRWLSIQEYQVSFVILLYLIMYFPILIILFALALIILIYLSYQKVTISKITGNILSFVFLLGVVFIALFLNVHSF